MRKVILLCVLLLNNVVVFAQVITTIAGRASGGSTSDGIPATNANIGFPGYMVFDSVYGYYFGCNFYKIKKISTIGVISTFAGNGTAGYIGDGMSATGSEISLPGQIALDQFGNLYIPDINNSRIRKVDKLTGTITTIAGNGALGYSGDGGPATAAQLSQPWAIAFDTADNLYFADVGNYRIRKIDLSGIISTIAGIGTFGTTGDNGPASAAQLASMEALRMDVFGNLYIAETEKIRKINLYTGIITCVAGIGLVGYSGDGGPATSAALWNAVDVLPDNYGNFYISEEYNNVIRKVDVSGVITTVAGNHTAGYSGDGGNATSAQLNYPRGLALDACGNLYILDAQNGRIRKVTYPPILTTPTISLSGASSYPAGSTVTVTASVGSAGASYLIHWFNHGIEFTTTTVPSVAYTKPPGTDTITARIVPTGWGCWDSTTSSQHIVSTDVTGVSSVNEPWCMVYPNPVQTTLMAVTLWKEGALTIYNTVGQTVLAKQFYKRGIRVNVGNLPAGIYMLKITGAENQTVITKFIKQ
jgi:hypothetical protein